MHCHSNAVNTEKMCKLTVGLDEKLQIDLFSVTKTAITLPANRTRGLTVVGPVQHPCRRSCDDQEGKVEGQTQFWMETGSYQNESLIKLLALMSLNDPLGKNPLNPFWIHAGKKVIQMETNS